MRAAPTQEQQNVPPDPTPSRAAAYLRISKDALKLGLGVDRQDELCRQVAARRGWTIVETYVDNDISASIQAPRPAYERLCADVSDGRLDGIIAVDQDRLTRHPRELEDLIDLTDAAAVPIALSSGELDLTSSDDRLRARMLGAVAKQESEKKSERIRRQKDWARRNGRWLGQAPFGYRTVDAPDGRGRVLEAVPAEAAIVVELARRILDGDTLHAAARWASEYPDAITRAGRSSWSPMAVRRAITHPATAGWQPHNGDLFRHPDTGQTVRVTDDPVLDQVTWHRIQRLFAARKRTGTTGRSDHVLLARLAVCAHCRHTMSYSRGGARGNARYVCRTSSERSGDCPGNTAAAHHVHELVDTWAAAHLDDLITDTLGRNRTATLDPEAQAEVAHLTALLYAQEQERRQLLLDGASPARIAAVTETLDIVDAKLTAAQARLDRTHRTVDIHQVTELVAVTDPAGSYLAADIPTRRRILTHLTDRVEIIPAGRVAKRGRFDPDRVEIIPAGRG